MTRPLLVPGALLLTAGLLLADIDAHYDPGNPLDRIPVPSACPTPAGGQDTPTPGSASDPRTPSNRPRETSEDDPPSEGPGRTMDEKLAQDPPFRVQVPHHVAASDIPSHLGWKPPPEVQVGRPSATSTQDPAASTSRVPGLVPLDLYMRGLAAYLVVMIHPGQVSEYELTGFLIDMGEPAAVAAESIGGAVEAPRMAKTVLSAVGRFSREAAPLPKDRVARLVYDDLLSRHAYERGFAPWIFSNPSRDSLPVLLDIVAKERHPFLVRNAVFMLRCYNDPIVLPVLRKLLQESKDPVIRHRALTALVRWKDPAIVPWLVKQLDTADPAFRIHALWALNRIGGDLSVEAVLGLLQARSNDGAILWTGLPVLACLAERASPETQAKASALVVRIQRLIPTLPEPEPWKAPGRETPEEPQVRRKILLQRARIALARLGSKSDQDWLRDRGRLSGPDAVHGQNALLVKEALAALEAGK